MSRGVIFWYDHDNGLTIHVGWSRVDHFWFLTVPQGGGEIERHVVNAASLRVLEETLGEMLPGIIREELQKFEGK
jgi:hypothetical protein